jgi:hypothetical protein
MFFLQSKSLKFESVQKKKPPSLAVFLKFGLFCLARCFYMNLPLSTAFGLG